MRHATAPGTFDPPGFRLDDCATQRNLSAEGRREAQRIGSYLKRIGLNPGEVLTSQWCRARDTANLAFGASRDWPALDSFIRSPHTERTQVGAVLSRIAQIKPGDRPLVLVTHQVVITAVTGIYPDSGEIVVVAPADAPGKGVKVVGRLDPDHARPR